MKGVGLKSPTLWRLMGCSNRNWTMLEHKNLVPIIALVLGAKWLLQNLDCSFKSAQCVVNILAFKHEERTFGLTCCINWGLATPPPPLLWGLATLPPPLLFEHIDIVIILEETNILWDFLYTGCFGPDSFEPTCNFPQHVLSAGWMLNVNS